MNLCFHLRKPSFVVKSAIYIPVRICHKEKIIMLGNVSASVKIDQKSDNNIRFRKFSLDQQVSIWRKENIYLSVLLTNFR